MPRGRPPKQPERDPAAITGQTAVSALLPPPDKGLVACVICQDGVKSIPAHLLDAHPTIRLEEYRAAYPTAPLEHEKVRRDRQEAKRQAITVTEREAADHPCGTDGAMLEKNLAEEERPHFRRDCLTLLARGYLAGYEVAAVAHTMTLARRARLDIEATRAGAEGNVYQSETLDLLKELEAKLEKGLQQLERARIQRNAESGENPLAALEAEQRLAEDWVRANIGEFAERCPGCGQMLTPPALPHWAFEPAKNDQGVQYWPVWSGELWKLVVKREIPLWIMAYTLRTSPEGLRFTARRKGVAWPSWIELGWEEQQLRARLVEDDRVTPTELARQGESHG